MIEVSVEWCPFCDNESYIEARNKDKWECQHCKERLVPCAVCAAGLNEHALCHGCNDGDRFELCKDFKGEFVKDLTGKAPNQNPVEGSCMWCDDGNLIEPEFRITGSEPTVFEFVGSCDKCGEVTIESYEGLFTGSRRADKDGY